MPSNPLRTIAAPELRGRRPGDVDQADRRGRLLGGVDDARDRIEPLVSNRRDADVGRAISLRPNARQRREERGLARARRPDDADVESHGSAF